MWVKGKQIVLGGREETGGNTRQVQGTKHEAKVKMRYLGSGDHGRSTAPTILTSRTNSTKRGSESVRKIRGKYGAPVPETESATRGSLTKQEDAGPRLVGRG